MEKPTINDVAQHAGVSVATVSRVVNEIDVQMRPETRRRVERAIAELGYVPSAAARTLRTGRSNVIALIIPDITNPIWAETADGVQDAAYEHEYSIVLCSTGWDGTREQEYIDLARHSSFAGLILNPIWATAEDLKESGVPAVILGVREGFEAFDQVGVDVVAGVKSAMAHFCKLGHRQIGLITGPLGTRSGRVRQTGYLEGLCAHELEIRPEWVIEAPFTREGGYQAMLRLLALDQPPTAVFAANDIMAVGALEAARSQGISVPYELSLIGFDDTTVARVTTPALTTVTYPKRRRGENAIRFLLGRIDGSGPAERQRKIFPCTLVERQSCAPPPRHRFVTADATS